MMKAMNINFIKMLKNFGKIFHDYYSVLTSNSSRVGGLNFLRVCSTQNEFLQRIPVQSHLRLVPPHINRENIRFKSKGRKGGVRSSADSDDEFSDDEYTIKEGEFDKDGGKVKKLRVPSLRMDQILKAGFGLSRRRIEENLFSSKLRFNGKSVSKKGMEVVVGDEFELFADSTLGDISSKSLGKFVIKKIEPAMDSSMYTIYISDHKN